MPRMRRYQTQTHANTVVELLRGQAAFVDQCQRLGLAEAEHSPGASGTDSLGFGSRLNRHESPPTLECPCLASAVALIPCRGAASREASSGIDRLANRPSQEALKHGAFFRRRTCRTGATDTSPAKTVKVVKRFFLGRKVNDRLRMDCRYGCRYRFKKPNKTRHKMARGPACWRRTPHFRTSAGL
jgi:hypothetical protein